MRNSARQHLNENAVDRESPTLDHRQQLAEQRRTLIDQRDAVVPQSRERARELSEKRDQLRADLHVASIVAADAATTATVLGSRYAEQIREIEIQLRASASRQIVDFMDVEIPRVERATGTTALAARTAAAALQLEVLDETAVTARLEALRASIPPAA